MTCIKIKTKKYQTRKGPPYHAKDCKGLVKKGNDHKDYISAADSRGVYKWVVKEKGARVTLKKKGVKTYTIYAGNFTEPFVADVSSNHVEIYKQILKKDKSVEKFIRDKKVLDIPYKKIFIGDNDLKVSMLEPKGKYPGNSLLIQIGDGKYIYVGHEIYSFETKDGENIKMYYSGIGNSLPYPYAIGENNTYFMLNKETVPNQLLDLKKDAYAQFYGYTIEDETHKHNIEASKKKFKSKIIHKRHMP